MPKTVFCGFPGRVQGCLECSLHSHHCLKVSGCGPAGPVFTPPLIIPPPHACPFLCPPTEPLWSRVLSRATQDRCASTVDPGEGLVD